MRTLLLVAMIIGITIPAMAEDDFLKAVNSGDVATVKSMLARDPALANAKNAKGTSAVISALFINKGEGFLDPAKNEMLQAILAQKPHLDIFETAALGTAAQLDAMLTDADAVNRRTHFGWTLLHMSAFGGNVATTELLLKKGAAIDVRARHRSSATRRCRPRCSPISTRPRRSCSSMAPTRWSASRKASRRCTKARQADASTSSSSSSTTAPKSTPSLTTARRRWPRRSAENTRMSWRG